MFRKSIVCFLARILTKNIGWIRNVLNKSATEEFRNNVNCEGITTNLWPIYLLGGEYITVGNHFCSQPGIRVECIDKYENESYSPVLRIGECVCINYRCHIGCINRITIGNHVLIGSNVLITDHAHGCFSEENKDIPWAKKKLYSKGPVIIEDNVWIGENVCVMPGVTIGKGSVVGANTVVTHDIPPYSMAVGVPAKVIKTLYNNTTVRLNSPGVN